MTITFLSVCSFIVFKTPLIWTLVIGIGACLIPDERIWVSIIGYILQYGGIIAFFVSIWNFLCAIWKIIEIPLEALQDVFLGKYFFKRHELWDTIVYPNDTVRKIFHFIGYPIYYILLICVISILLFGRSYESGAIQKDIEYEIGEVVVVKNDENEKYLATITKIIPDENINKSIFMAYELDTGTYGKIGLSDIDGDKILGRYVPTNSKLETYIKTIPYGYGYVLFYLIDLIPCVFQLIFELFSTTSS